MYAMSTARLTTLPHALLWHGRSVAAGDPLVAEMTSTAQIAPADIHAVDGTELTVKELANLRRFAHQSPTMSPAKLILLTNADRLSIPVANALLKLIEEPPPHLLIRLSAAKLTAVLPTIRSRCQLTFVGTSPTIDDRFPLTQIDNASITDRFALADQLSKDDQLEAIVTSWLIELETQLLRGKPVSAKIHATAQLMNRLGTNASRRVALEAWILPSNGDTTTDSFTDGHR